MKQENVKRGVKGLVEFRSERHRGVNGFSHTTLKQTHSVIKPDWGRYMVNVSESRLSININSHSRPVLSSHCCLSWGEHVTQSNLLGMWRDLNLLPSDSMQRPPSDKSILGGWKEVFPNSSDPRLVYLALYSVDDVLFFQIFILFIMCK